MTESCMCGGKIKTIFENLRYTVECMRCKKESLSFDEEAKALADWKHINENTN